MSKKKKHSSNSQAPRDTLDNKELLNSGVTQPHQAKKESLGPNTNR